MSTVEIEDQCPVLSPDGAWRCVRPARHLGLHSHPAMGLWRQPGQSAPSLPPPREEPEEVEPVLADPDDPTPEVANPFGLPLGTEVVAELTYLAGSKPVRVAGVLTKVIGGLVALEITDDAGSSSLVPWHAVGRVIRGLG